MHSSFPNLGLKPPHSRADLGLTCLDIFLKSEHCFDFYIRVVARVDLECRQLDLSLLFSRHLTVISIHRTVSLFCLMFSY